MTTRRAKSLSQKLVDAKRAGWGKWIRSAADEHAVCNGCYFDLEAAERVRTFFRELLVHSKGSKFAGKPFELLDWQFQDVIGPIFGWKRPDGTRRYRRAYTEIPKKNGKSTLAAGVSIYLLVGDREPGAHVFSCASDRDQAGIVYEEAANMVEASFDLSQVLKVRRSTKVIMYEETRSKYEAISSDADSSEGKNAHGLICDELHVWRGRQFFESLKYAGRARAQPLLFMITTAGDDLTSVCYEEHERSQRIIRGDEFLDSYFGYVAAADPDDDWKDPKTWHKANPSLGITIDEQSFAEDVQDAAGTPTKENAFKRYSLNLWIGASNAWLSMDDWQKCEEPFDVASLAGLDAYGGADLSRKRDLSAVVWIVPQDDLLYVVPRLYVPAELLQRKEEEDKVPYRAWAEAGYITPTPGNVIDYAHIRRDVLADNERFRIIELGYDPYNAEQLCNQQLGMEDGIATIEIPQSMANMGPPSSEFEKLLKEKRIRVPPNPVLAWMASGCVAYEDTNGNLRPIKRKSRSRIDGIIALIMALNRYLDGSTASGSYYDDHDLETG
jgi:phage terminase large subunit-like protein